MYSIFGVHGTMLCSKKGKMTNVKFLYSPRLKTLLIYDTYTWYNLNNIWITWFYKQYNKGMARTIDISHDFTNIVRHGANSRYITLLFYKDYNKGITVYVWNDLWIRPAPNPQYQHQTGLLVRLNLPPHVVFSKNEHTKWRKLVFKAREPAKQFW